MLIIIAYHIRFLFRLTVITEFLRYSTIYYVIIEVVGAINYDKSTITKIGGFALPLIQIPVRQLPNIHYCSPGE